MMKTFLKTFLEKLPLILGAFMISGLVIYSFIDIAKMNSLDKNIEYTNAVIVDFSTGPRSRRYIDYKFLVNGKAYYESGKHYPKSDTLSIGDSIGVVYDKTNPDYSRAYRDYKKFKDGVLWY